MRSWFLDGMGGSKELLAAMGSRLTSSVAFITVLTVVLAGSGLPMHGHSLDHDHDEPHVEHPHHAHNASYAQGDHRLTTQAPKIIATPVVGSPRRLPDLVTAVIVVSLETSSPSGRHPPTRPARAPPA